MAVCIVLCWSKQLPIVAGICRSEINARPLRITHKTGTLMKAQSQSEQFGNYPAELRLQFKPKRNFIKLLDGLARGNVASR